MRLRSRVTVIAFLATFLVAFTPAVSAAQGIRLGGDEVSATLRGILGGTLFAQDALFATGNGQRAQFVAGELDEWWHGGDVRNARLTLRLDGPRVRDDWRAHATFEMDFFAGHVGAGSFADEQPTPRLRLAFAELSNGRTSVRVGQDWALTLGQIPVSVSHIGFALGWGPGGFIGWRFPGVFLDHRLSDDGAERTIQVRLAVMQGSWNVEERDGGVAQPDLPDAGRAGTPQLEARLNVNGTRGDATWNAYVVGHYDRKDLTGVTDAGDPEPEGDDLTSWAWQAGGQARRGSLTLQTNAYIGRAMGHHFAHIIQFGDFGGWGAWAQAGYDFARDWGVWLYAGTDQPDESEIRDAGQDRLGSWLVVPMLRFQSGPYAAGIEWLHNQTVYVEGAGEDTRVGRQIAFSVRFDF